MANADINTTRQDAMSAVGDFESPDSARLDALDTLNHAIAVAELVQGITLLPGRNAEVHLTAKQVDGLFYVLQDMIARLNRVGGLVSQYEFVKAA